MERIEALVGLAQIALMDPIDGFQRVIDLVIAIAIPFLFMGAIGIPYFVLDKANSAVMKWNRWVLRFFFAPILLQGVSILASIAGPAFAEAFVFFFCGAHNGWSSTLEIIGKVLAVAVHPMVGMILSEALLAKEAERKNRVISTGVFLAAYLLAGGALILFTSGFVTYSLWSAVEDFLLAAVFIAHSFGSMSEQQP